MIASLVTEALHDKYQPAFGARAHRAMRVVVDADLARADTLWMVAERRGAMAGVVHLALHQSPEGGVLGPLAREIGLPRAARAGLVLSLLSHARLAPGEAYLEELAVAPHHRRRGVGRALVEACAREATERGRERLTLWVAEDNAGARALYETSGFIERRRRRSLLGRVVFGMGTALYLERPLPSRASR